MNSQRSKWEGRYRDRGEEQPKDASRFLQHYVGDLRRGRALDVACGDGRNALLLARRGFEVDAVDFAQRGLRRAQSAARSEGLAVRFVQADLEQFSLPRDLYTVVVNVRYLQRSLFGPMQAALRNGGVLVFETFLKDQAGVGHPSNPRFLLEPGELARAFPDLKIVMYEEGLFDTESGSAHLARMVARRSPSY